MEFVQGVVSFLVTMLILNGVCWATGSNMRFGWYKKDEQEYVLKRNSFGNKIPVKKR